MVTLAGCEFVSYVGTYGRGPSGYEGRLYAKTTDAQRSPRKVRGISKHGLDVRGFDVESAHFNIAIPSVVELIIDIDGHISNLETCAVS